MGEGDWKESTRRTKLNGYVELGIDTYGQKEAYGELQIIILDTVFVKFAGISAQQLKLIFLKIKKQNGCLTNLVLIDKKLTNCYCRNKGHVVFL